MSADLHYRVPMRSGKLLIRHVEPGDFERWLPLWDDYNEFYGRTGDRALRREITEGTWKRFLDSREALYGLVADADGALVGLAHYLFHPSTSSITPVCYLQDLFTADAVRGRGIATALIERVSSEAAKAGASRVYWQTHETNVVAQRVYERLAERPGFVIYRKSIPD